MNRRSYLCLYVYDNSKEFKIGIAGFSIYGTKSEKLRFYLGSSSRNFFSPPKLKMLPRALSPRYTRFYHFGKNILPNPVFLANEKKSAFMQRPTVYQ